MIVQWGGNRLELLQGDLTEQIVDAIVNAANVDLAGGGGVDGAIHRAAGSSLMEETGRLYPDGCLPGDAVMTGAGAGNGTLSARFIFHAVGPIWEGGHRGEPELLASVHRRCLELAVEHRCASIAFPAISTGAYRYPIDLAAETALQTVRQFFVEEGSSLNVQFVLFDAGSFGAYARVLESMIQ